MYSHDELFYAHSSIILIFLFLVAAQLGKWSPNYHSCKHKNISTLGYIYYSHYINVIMTTMVSKITSLTVVYSTVYSDAEQIKHQSPASLAFVLGIHRDRWIPRTKGQLRGKCFHLMTSSCICTSCRVFIVASKIAMNSVHSATYDHWT